MKFLKTLSYYLILSLFMTNSLFADVTQSEENKKETILEEEIAPPPLPSALIDLNQNNKEEKKRAKYSSLYLFLFNVVMFTTGMVVVKNITGTKV
jgi:hypothetical protein